ncbi:MULTISPECIES: alpha-D-glucose phosphate-specific phosphoglucomutase [unclassified Thioalkalivibrio]|uniref:alpha-D-glucose phosphate-specific phosphoglucomutase n=1 Tax=unclassified Thioalkalivibrio TaxID=2621013 RepID=UPI00036039D6|nr:MULTISPECIES: alpha-D-glucose phosphate-specific phosphoglucomutase [unclassified Thioalkalivibrio]
MDISVVTTRPFTDQRPGTSGLRKRVRQFRQPHYLENFVQSIFEAHPSLCEGELILGGDGRFHNREAIQTILRMAAANGVKKVAVGHAGLLSTPAASHLIRSRGATGAIILSASHNAGGPEGDFGVKLNTANGGPAPPGVTDAIYEHSKSLTHYRIASGTPHVDIDHLHSTHLGEMSVEIIDPVGAYADHMATLFDLERIGELLRSDFFRMRFDAMHAVTGPYAEEILINRLGAPAETLLRAEPLADFGGRHPDPNLAHTRELCEALYGRNPPDFGAASDGDGDRNLILGPHFFVTPSDSLAIMAANAHLIPAFSDGLKGVARSMPTSQAVDVVAKALGIPCFETPTGWKFFGNLLDDGRIRLCGEESFGTSSDHVREKDGLWAVLFWLNLLAARRQSVEEIVRDHWRDYGRHYYTRHDYEALDTARAEQVMARIGEQLSSLPGQSLAGMRVAETDDFAYRDPVDGGVTEHQGLRVLFEGGARIVFRLSGTGTEGATLRIYIEQYETHPEHLDREPQELLRPLIEAAVRLGDLPGLAGRDKPDVIT